MNQELRKHVIELLDKGTRLDGRGLLEYRKPITVEYDVSKSAEGSARVKIGDTEVLAGVKMEVSTPYPDTQEEGCFMVNTELIPLSNPEFESGPPSIGAVELARVIDRGIRESKVLDFKKLCIEEGEKVWIVLIDIMTINVDGNLFDAASLGAMIALKNTKLPKLEDNKVNYKELTKEQLPLSKKDPVSVTIYKIGDSLLVDPTAEEEKAVDSRLTVATTKEGYICAMQKGGAEPLSIEDIDKMVELAVKKCDELRSHIK